MGLGLSHLFTMQEEQWFHFKTEDVLISLQKTHDIKIPTSALHDTFFGYISSVILREVY